MEQNDEKPRKRRRPVRVACTNCKRAHGACSNSRPCLRCVQYGIADTCREEEDGASPGASRINRSLQNAQQALHTLCLKQEHPYQALPNIAHFAFAGGSPGQQSQLETSGDEDLLGHSSPANCGSPSLTGSSDDSIVLTRAELEKIVRNQALMREALRTKTEEVHLLRQTVAEYEGQLPIMSNPSEQVGVAIWRLADRTFVDANTMFCKMADIPLGILRQRFMCIDLFPRQMLPALNECYMQLREGIQSPMSYSLTFVQANLPVNVSVHLQSSPSGKFSFFVMVVQHRLLGDNNMYAHNPASHLPPGFYDLVDPEEDGISSSSAGSLNSSAHHPLLQDVPRLEPPAESPVAPQPLSSARAAAWELNPPLAPPPAMHTLDTAAPPQPPSDASRAAIPQYLPLPSKATSLSLLMRAQSPLLPMEPVLEGVDAQEFAATDFLANPDRILGLDDYSCGI
mmetsp:Transcript_51578/g.129391  ORF Transcript_51578/g.129391 Transcript_51578/m.129391 type:complete len:455 (-) Transcript_51578:1488-2852(-)